MISQSFNGHLHCQKDTQDRAKYGTQNGDDSPYKHSQRHLGYVEHILHGGIAGT